MKNSIHVFFIDFFDPYFLAGAALAGASAFITVLAGSAFLECLPLAKDTTGASAIVRTITPIITFLFV